MNKAVH
ncbi:hypothetical protein AB3S75_046491 [Citrus x aurantiifolia]